MGITQLHMLFSENPEYIFKSASGWDTFLRPSNCIQSFTIDRSSHTVDVYNYTAQVNYDVPHCILHIPLSFIYFPQHTFPDT